MSDESTAIDERSYYRIGRYFMDGADANWIAAREKTSVVEVHKAWEFCRGKLSAHLAATADDDRLLSDAELTECAEDCVRLLLGWSELACERERMAQTTIGKPDGVDGKNDESP